MFSVQVRARGSRSKMNRGRGVRYSGVFVWTRVEKKWKVQWWLIGVFRSEVMRVATGTHRSALSGRWIYSHHRDAAKSNHN